MGILEWIGLKRVRDKPQNAYEGQDFSYLFGRTTSGENVDEFKAMQTTAVYACVRILAEAIASLPLHVYERTLKRVAFSIYNIHSMENLGFRNQTIRLRVTGEVSHEQS